MKKNHVFCLCAVIFLAAFFLGFATNAATTPKAEVETETTGIEAMNFAGIAIEADFPNEAIVKFTLIEAIAPDFFVGYGTVGGSYEIFSGNSERWDPMGIGTDKAIGLIRQIRTEVPGITEGIHAKGHDLTITIAKSHLTRKDQIIEEVLAIIQDFLDNQAIA
ncbi:hypothetical protein FWH09_00060 [Candidatus Saccharibacteria bacterium]|nr:hypothetical protein [Candidatus Saccharibacteria bacterium]